MSDMRIVLDTNAIPRSGKLENVPISTVLRIASTIDAEVAITRTIFEECIYARTNAVQEALQKYSKSVDELSKYCNLDPSYVPTVAELVDDWRGQLINTFQVLELSGEDAIEALSREALRKKPAKQSGEGSRDAAIWLTVKRAHLAHDAQTHFVSNNSSDFAQSKSEASLHEDLERELGDRAVDFHYHTSIDALISAICSAVDMEIEPDDLKPEILLSMIDQIIGHEDLHNYPDFANLGADTFPPVEWMSVGEIQVRSGYLAGGVTLGFFTASFRMTLAEQREDVPGKSISGRLGGWAEKGDSESSRITRCDVTKIISIAYSAE